MTTSTCFALPISPVKLDSINFIPICVLVSGGACVELVPHSNEYLYMVRLGIVDENGHSFMKRDLEKMSFTENDLFLFENLFMRRVELLKKTFLPHDAEDVVLRLDEQEINSEGKVCVSFYISASSRCELTHN